MNAFSGFSDSSSLHREGRAGWTLYSAGDLSERFAILKFGYY
jgi:hypothetical protein